MSSPILPPAAEPAGPSRRALVAGAAWAVPAVVLVGAAPEAAASVGAQLTITNTSACWSNTGTSYKGKGAASISTGATTTPGWTDGAAGDLLLLLAGNSPVGTAPTAGSFSSVGTASVPPPGKDVRCTALQWLAPSAAIGSVTVTAAAASRSVSQVLRFTKPAGEDFHVTGYTATDIDAAGTTVSATASSVSVAPNDYLIVAAAFDAKTVSSPSLVVGGTTLTLTLVDTTRTNPGNAATMMYVGYVKITASLSGDAVFTATTGNNDSAAAVTITRIRTTHTFKLGYTVQNTGSWNLTITSAYVNGFTTGTTWSTSSPNVTPVAQALSVGSPAIQVLATVKSVADAVPSNAASLHIVTTPAYTVDGPNLNFASVGACA